MKNPFDFTGATALVVGGATGLGQAMAEALAAHGATVCVVSRSEDKARAAAKAIATKTDGNCSSLAADLSDEGNSRSFPLRTSYASSKGALLQLTRTLALEWAAHNITVNAISPGPILTDMTRPILDNPDAYRQLVANVPLGRFGEPHEVVPACLFLASPASSFVTGADIVVDGGWMAT